METAAGGSTGSRDSFTGPLTADQLESYRRDGFLIVRQLFDTDEMKCIRAWTDDVQNWPEAPGKYMMYFEQSQDNSPKRLLNRVENFLPYHDEFRNLATGEKMQGICGRLFGERAVLFKDKINFKLPGGGGFESHQDVQAGWSTYAQLHITVLISIDRSTIANGCLELAAGRHKSGLIGEEWKPLTDNDLSDSDYQPVETEPGDAVFFDSYCPHRSEPNNTDQPRRVLYITYNRLSEGNHLAQYYADKRISYPPDIERVEGREYKFRV